ncbi:MAG: hypothetical protein JST20_13645 [Bacteroidetes bacterium]|nr:hypothetical protein [Bacteroidota bacterium]
MLRKIILTSLIIGLPIVIYIAMQYGQVPSVSFKKALEAVNQKTDSEQNSKVKIQAGVVIDKEHPFKQEEFYAVDAEGTVFFVSYTGGDALGELKNGKSIEVLGHVHGGNPPYFHTSEIK